MTSKIKVDNIENQCGGAVVTKCGATTTISGSVVKADDIQAADGGNLINQCGTTITLGASGDTINLASGASQTGFGRTGTVDWDTTPKTASFTAVSGNGYFVNTTSSAITVTLPAGSANAIVSLADYAATWQTNNVTVTPNGSDNIGGQNENATLNTQGQSVTFVYVDSTQGWINTMDSTSNVRGSIPFLTATGGTITTSGNCKIHTFTGPGTFCVSAVASTAANNEVSYIVVAGGGGAGHGGGGGGGYREVVSPTAPYTGSPLNGYATAPNRITVTATAFPITVGAGGAGGPNTGTCQTSGANSIFSTITSTGGGKGGSGNSGGSPSGVPTVNAKGATGGSGGGSGASGSSGVTVPGGLGNTPPVSPAQGTNGGAGRFVQNSYGGGGGGGGAAGCGGCYSCGEGITGGPGVVSNITAAPVTYSRGGPSPDTANSGNGSVDTGNSGIVVIRYKFQ